MNSRVTAIGFIIIAAFVGLFVFAFFRLTPIYLEQMKVASILNDVKVNLDNQNATIIQIKSAIEKRLDVEMVYGRTRKDFKIVRTGNWLQVLLRTMKIARITLAMSTSSSYLTRSVEIYKVTMAEDWCSKTLGLPIFGYEFVGAGAHAPERIIMQ